MDAFHVWAFPIDGGAPVWVGAASPVARPDVAGIFGPPFMNAGFERASAMLPPGSSRAYFARPCCTSGSWSSSIIEVDLVSGAVLPPVAVRNEECRSILIAPDGGRLFRSCRHFIPGGGRGHWVGRIEALRITASGLVPDWAFVEDGHGEYPFQINLSADGQYVLGGWGDQGDVSWVLGRTVTITEAVTGATRISHVIAYPGGDLAVLLAGVDGSMPTTRMRAFVRQLLPGIVETQVIDVATGDVRYTVAGWGSYTLFDLAANAMYAFDSTSLRRVDNDTLQPTTTIATGTGWLSAAVLPEPCPTTATASPAGFTTAASSGTLTIAAAGSCSWTIDPSGVPGRSLGTLSGTGSAVVPFSLASVAAPASDTFRVGTRRVRIDRTQPVMAIDAPAGGSVAQPFTLRGYAIVLTANASTASPPPPTVSTVHVWAWPLLGGAPLFVGAVPATEPRSDVAARYGDAYVTAGFSVPVHGLPTGTYAIVAYAQGARSGIFTQQAGVLVSVQAGTRVAIDSPAPSPPRNFVVSGWAIDLGSTGGPGVDAVHVWAYPAGGGAPVWVGAADYGGARPDVGAAFGSQFTNSGYWLFASLAPGDYTLVVFARSIATGEFNSQTEPLTVTGGSAVEMNLDVPAADDPPPVFFKSFTMLGWAIDRGAAGGTGIDAFHVWAFPIDGSAPIFGGTASTWARSDVAAIFGPQFLQSGFLVNVALPAGTYDVAVFAHSSVIHDFSAWRVVRVRVAAPF